MGRSPARRGDRVESGAIAQVGAGRRHKRPFYDCTLGQLQQSMTWPEFRQLGQQATAGDAAATIVACANQLPRAGA